MDYLKRPPYRIFNMLFLAISFFPIAARSQLIKNRGTEILYSKAQLDQVDNIHKTLSKTNPVFKPVIAIDASLTIMRDWIYDPHNVLVYYTSPWGEDWYAGGSFANKDFLNHVNYEAEAFDMSTRPQMWSGVTTEASKIAQLNKNYVGAASADAVGFLANIYKIGINSNHMADMLAFVHIERSNVSTGNAGADRLYAIGIAFSNNQGTTWTYAGDVIRPAYDVLGDHWAWDATRTYMSNIGGIPYTVVRENGQDYFYVYFNEFEAPAPGASPNSTQYISVAKVLVSDAISQARAGTVDISKWKKYGRTGAWDQNSLTGTGKPLLPFTSNSPFTDFYDAHGDAAYCASVKKHFLVANHLGGENGTVFRSIVLFSSSDGLNWNSQHEIDKSLDNQTNAYWPDYGSFYSSMDVASDDSHIIGKDFNIVYIRRNSLMTPTGQDFPVDNSDLMSTSLTALPDFLPSLNPLLQ